MSLAPELLIIQVQVRLAGRSPGGDVSGIEGRFPEGGGSGTTEDPSDPKYPAVASK